MALDEHSTVEVRPVDRSKVWLLVKVAIILAVITIGEFILAYTLPETMKWSKISIFVLLTIVKAFYIVAEFMHLKYEVKSLIWSILIPFIFVVWLIIALIYEGGAIFEAVYN